MAGSTSQVFVNRDNDMAKRITYVQSAEYHMGSGLSQIDPGILARNLQEHEIPSAFIRRDPEIDPANLQNVSEIFLKRNVLPIVELHPGDDPGPMRNLGEVACCGVMNVHFRNSEPSFDPGRFMETLNAAGRHRLPLDIHIVPGDGTADNKLLDAFLKNFNLLADKYGHIQTVYLAALPPPENRESQLNFFNAMVKNSHGATPSIVPSLWMGAEALRNLASDLGIIPFSVDPGGEILVEKNPVGSIKYFGDSAGLEIAPRLPLIRKFYRKGFYSFEVGKVLDSWVDRTAYRDYSERPVWLEDS